MAFRLSKDENKRRNELAGELRTKREELDKAVEAFNEALSAAKEALGQSLDAYNEVLADARSFCEDIGNNAENEISEKSERWQDSDKGQAAQSWADEWSNTAFDDVSIDLPDDISVDADDHAETLEGLPEEADA